MFNVSFYFSFTYFFSFLLCYSFIFSLLYIFFSISPSFFFYLHCYFLSIFIFSPALWSSSPFLCLSSYILYKTQRLLYDAQHYHPYLSWLPTVEVSPGVWVLAKTQTLSCVVKHYNPHLSWLTIINISPGVMWLDNKVGVVQNSESVNDVSAERWVNVLGPVLANARTVPRPVGEVTDDLVVSWRWLKGNDGNAKKPENNWSGKQLIFEHIGKNAYVSELKERISFEQ